MFWLNFVFKTKKKKEKKQKPHNRVLHKPLTKTVFVGKKNNNRDIFLGNWTFSPQATQNAF